MQLHLRHPRKLYEQVHVAYLDVVTQIPRTRDVLANTSQAAQLVRATVWVLLAGAAGTYASLSRDIVVLPGSWSYPVESRRECRVAFRLSKAGVPATRQRPAPP